MKSPSRSFLGAVSILLASASFGFAQTSGYYSTHTVAAPGAVSPGTVNYVEGQVSSAGRTLDPQAVGHFSLQPGQTLETGKGYVEVLLTPGTFFRVGPNSAIRMEAAGLADTRVDLTGGSALLEVDQIIEGAHLTVGVSNTSADVLKKGLYSFNADQGAVRVLDGKLKLVGVTKSREVGKHDEVMLANGDNLKTRDFDERAAKQDSLYVWSESRSRQESGENQLAAENSAGYAPVGNGWYWSPYTNYYGFWPASAFLYSPFGFRFSGGYYPGFYGSGFYGAGLYRGYYPYRAYRGYPSLRYSRPLGVHSAVGGFHSGLSGGFHGGRR